MTAPPTILDSPRTLPRLAAALRAGGVAVGSDAVLLAAEGLAAVDPARRTDVRACLSACLIRDPADFELFDRLFDALFPLPRQGARDSVPALPQPRRARPSPAMKRLAQALVAVGSVRTFRRRDEHEADAGGTASDALLWQNKDFEQMSAAELELARRLLRVLPEALGARRTRRTRPAAAAAAASRLDLRRLLRAAARGREAALPRRSPVVRPWDWVVIVDVSGSMAAYARMFLQFAHALRRGVAGLEAFTFSTELTRISRALTPLDPDRAIEAITATVRDWDGGTRIGACLAQFNQQWARRVLARGACVLLLTDGLERGPPAELEVAVARLARSARELVWVNPLMRSARYEPLAAGARILERHATLRRSAHSIASLMDLARLLGARRNSRPESRRG
jgi:uncharacterized protein with von Willebrand factor type A (vWA) domain